MAEPAAPGAPAGEAAPAATADAVTVPVVVDVPRHGMAGTVLDYRHPQPLPAGALVRVPLGRRVVPGIVWDRDGAAEAAARAAPASAGLKAVAEVQEALPPLSPAWRALVRFAAAYYQRAEGELALSVLPGELRAVDATQLDRRLRRLHKAWAAAAPGAGGAAAAAAGVPALSTQQRHAVDALAAAPAATHLLFGATGSGKTEVYLHEAARVLAAGRQALVLVPEINLTPQLEARFAARFPQRRIVSLHSGLTPAQRLAHWLAAHLGWADLLLGTRMAVFASLPRLGLVVVDEEHDPSYKQQEGARYSARDLAVARGRLEDVPVLLGSATPSLETWFNALPPAAAGEAGDPARHGSGRYRRLDMPERVGGAVLPTVRLADLKALAAQHGAAASREPLAPPVLAALRERLARGEQSLVLLNRRGFAPVLHCPDCGWKSGCAHCSAWRVFHKGERSLRCHHCGFTEAVPRACPDCGNADIQPIGRGTERLEEHLAELLPGARIGRIDADTTRAAGSLQAQLARVHDGEIDVLVGTQMVAKGHDFRRITLVAALNADAALFSSDFRAPERLFALLMQAGGRAGRDAAQTGASELWVQTWFPAHPLYAALRAHDYPAFARAALAERHTAGLPPFTHFALVRAEAREFARAAEFLHAAAHEAQASVHGAGVTVYPVVPASVQRVANVDRAQMLVEAAQRPLLQRFLADWVPRLHPLKAAHKRVLRWAVDVDPAAI